MLAIKLQRIGRLNQPSYRVIVAEKKTKLKAPPVEDLGSYNPFTKQTNLKQDRIKYWLGVGAQPTVTIHNLLVKAGALSAAKIRVKMKKKAEEPTAEKSAPKAAQAEIPSETA